MPAARAAGRKYFSDSGPPRRSALITTQRPAAHGGSCLRERRKGGRSDGSGVGLGTRSKRYAALVEDGVVKTLNVEDSPGVAVESTAAKILERL